MRDILTRGLAQLGLPADAVPQLEAYAQTDDTEVLAQKLGS